MQIFGKNRFLSFRCGRKVLIDGAGDCSRSRLTYRLQHPESAKLPTVRQKCAVKKEKYLYFLDIATMAGGIHQIVSNVRANTVLLASLG